MRDRIAPTGSIAAVAEVIGICCGLPVLLSIGVVGAFADWSLQSWILIGLVLALAAAGTTRWARRRGRTCHADAPILATDTTTKEHHP